MASCAFDVMRCGVVGGDFSWCSEVCCDLFGVVCCIVVGVSFSELHFKESYHCFGKIFYSVVTWGEII